MARKRTSTVRSIALISLLLNACSPMRGCLESEFDLAVESRLPRWFQLPPNVSRTDVGVKLKDWTAIWNTGPAGEFIMADKHGKQLGDVITEFRRLPSSPQGLSYPQYWTASTSGVIEVIEFKRVEPLFYVSDDPTIRAPLGAR